MAYRDPVSWEVTVNPKTLFSYWPGKTDSASALEDFEAALVAAGLTAKEAQVRTTGEVFIETGPGLECVPGCRDLSVHAYTRFAGKIIPAANQHCMESPRDAFFRRARPPDEPAGLRNVRLCRKVDAMADLRSERAALETRAASPVRVRASL